MSTETVGVKNLKLIKEVYAKKRDTVASDLYTYIKETTLKRPNYVDGAHIKTICDTVMNFLKDDTKDTLVISTPPRHMKSTIISEALPCWYLSKYPQNEVIIGSYNQTQARKMCRACRMNFDEPAHLHWFPSKQFKVDTADEFMFEGKKNGRPSLIAAGVGSGLTGSGANLVILDDTVKDFQDASSDVIRENIINWYQSVIMTRLAPKGKVIMVQTRWHYHDLPGVVLEESDPNKIIHLNLPAIDKDGKALWPERYDIPELMKIKSHLRSLIWNALYMGRPTPEEGGMFKREWVRLVHAPAPANAIRFRYWDKAATHDGGDWTVGVLMAKWDGRYIIEDIQRIQGSPAEVQALIRATAQRDGTTVPIRMEQEPGSSGVDIIDYYARRILEGFDFRPDHITGDKAIRAGPMAAAMENGYVDMLVAPWNRTYLDELIEFPLGEHDDQVDASGGAFKFLAETEEPTLYFF